MNVHANFVRSLKSPRGALLPRPGGAVAAERVVLAPARTYGLVAKVHAQTSRCSGSNEAPRYLASAYTAIPTEGRTIDCHVLPCFR